MPINTDFLIRCNNTLETASEQLQQREPGEPLYEILSRRLREAVRDRA